MLNRLRRFSIFLSHQLRYVMTIFRKYNPLCESKAPKLHWLKRIGFELIGFVLTRPHCNYVKGDSNPNGKYVYQKELYEPWILIQVSSKSVHKWKSYGHLKNSIWPTFNRHFEYLISFQNIFNCLIFSNKYYHNIWISAYMQLYT